MKNLFLTLIILLTLAPCFAGDDDHEVDHRKHKIAPMMGYTYVFDAIDSEFGTTSANRLVPTFGLDYTYTLNHKWTIGWFNDIELGTYTISSINNGERLIRERVFVTALVGMYKLTERFSVLMGAGLEIEHHKNFGVLRIGMDYEVPINENWATGFGMTYDYKEDYSALGFGVSFGRSF